MLWALLDVIARTGGSPGADDADLLAQLRAVVAETEMPGDRLLARYRGRPAAPSRFYRAYGWKPSPETSLPL
jgi:hypothetical protein